MFSDCWCLLLWLSLALLGRTQDLITTCALLLYNLFLISGLHYNEDAKYFEHTFLFIIYLERNHHYLSWPSNWYSLPCNHLRCIQKCPDILDICQNPHNHLGLKLWFTIQGCSFKLDFPGNLWVTSCNWQLSQLLRNWTVEIVIV